MEWVNWVMGVGAGGGAMAVLKPFLDNWVESRREKRREKADRRNRLWEDGRKACTALTKEIATGSIWGNFDHVSSKVKGLAGEADLYTEDGEVTPLAEDYVMAVWEAREFETRQHDDMPEGEREEKVRLMTEEAERKGKDLRDALRERLHGTKG